MLHLSISVGRALAVTMLGLAAWLVIATGVLASEAIRAGPDPASSFSAQSRSVIAAYANREKAVQAELRRGLDRLSKACAAPTVGSAQPNPTDSLDLELRDLDRLSAPLAEQTLRLSLQVERRRAQACPVLPFLPKSADCRAAEDLRDGLTVLSQAATARRNDLIARYSLYAEAGRLEARSCASAGFTQRLIQADGQYMKPNVEQALGDWGRLLKSAEANAN